MRGRGGRRGGCALVLAVAVGLLLGGARRLPAAERGAGRGSWPRVHTASALRTMLEWTLDGAARRLESPECQAVFADFKDERGRPLHERMADLGVPVQTYLEWVVFYDGTDMGSCRRDGVLAFTGQGHRVVYVCRERFEREWMAGKARYAEIVLIHEMLHTLGLGENPPSSRDITNRVQKRCDP